MPEQHCSNCGAPIHPDAKFCSSCGHPATEGFEPAPAAPGPFGQRDLPPRRKTYANLGALIGGVVGVLVGLLAASLVDHALCPHGVLASCRSLSSKGRLYIIVLGVAVCVGIGGYIGLQITPKSKRSD
jgi:hypothetical protein